MEKQLKIDSKSFDVTSGVTIEEFNDKYNQIVSQLKDKYGYITDIKIYAECNQYNDCGDYVEEEEISIKYKRYETDEEFERRKNWIEDCKIAEKRLEIEKMKKYISSHTEEAIKYINSLTKK